MGERFLILEETADALDVIDPDLAVHFRTVNGLPQRQPDGALAGSARGRLEPAATHHEIRMAVGHGHLRSDCSCGSWSYSAGWDEIDLMVTEVREHVGSAHTAGADVVVAADAPVVTHRFG